MIRATRHTGIVVHDMKRSFHFWHDIMGLKVEVDGVEEGEFIDKLQHLDGVKVHIIKLSAPDGTLIELLRDEKHPRPAPPKRELCDCGISHVAFTVADAETSWQVLREAGCEVLSAPLVSPDDKAKVFFARDPEGNLIELVEMLR